MAAQRDRRGTANDEGKPASRARVRANRRNAKRSTGPRSAAGKCAACMNALIHGIFSGDAVLPGEDPAAFLLFRNWLIDSPGLRPQTPLELSMAEPYVLAKWKLRRVLAAEQVVHANISDSLMEVAKLPAKTLAEALRTRERLIQMSAENDAEERELLFGEDDADEDEDDEEEEDEDEAAHRRRAERAARLAEVEALVSPILAAAQPGGLPPAATLAASVTIKEHEGAFERLGRHAHRLELDADRALRQLRQLRKDMGVDVASLPGSPYVQAVPAAEPEPETQEEQDEHDGEDGEAHDDVGSAGVVTSASAPARGEDAGPRNEAKEAESGAGDGAEGTCDSGSRRIEVVTPTRLAPRDVRSAARDGQEGAD